MTLHRYDSYEELPDDIKHTTSPGYGRKYLLVRLDESHYVLIHDDMGGAEGMYLLEALLPLAYEHGRQDALLFQDDRAGRPRQVTRIGHYGKNES